MYACTVPESLDCEKLVQSIKEAMKKPHNFCKVCTTTREQTCNEQEQHHSSISSLSPSTSTDSLTTLRHLIVIEGTMILNIR